MTIESAVVVAFISSTALIITKIIERMAFAPDIPKYDQDAVVDSLLTVLRTQFQCARVTIYGYHNGGHWIDNSSISKFTVRHESTDRNTNALLPVLQGVSTGMLKEQPQILREKGILFEPDREHTAETVKIKKAYHETMSEFGVKATLAFGVFKTVWSWKRFKWSRQLVASIHFDWESTNYSYALLKSTLTRAEVCRHVTALVSTFDKKSSLKSNILELLSADCQEYNKTFNHE
jgi:hypothetical protein